MTTSELKKLADETGVGGVYLTLPIGPHSIRRERMKTPFGMQTVVEVLGARYGTLHPTEGECGRAVICITVAELRRWLERQEAEASTMGLAPARRPLS